MRMSPERANEAHGYTQCSRFVTCRTAPASHSLDLCPTLEGGEDWESLIEPISQHDKEVAFSSLPT
jgi:hypothetical protein